MLYTISYYGGRLRCGPPGGAISCRAVEAARQLAYTGSQRSQTSQRSQRSSQPSKRSWSSSQSLDEAGKDRGAF